MRSKRLLAKAKVAKQQELQATPTPPPKSSSQRQVDTFRNAVRFDRF